MGNAVSAKEKAAIKTFMRLTEETKIDIKKDQLEDLLQWGQRRGFFKDSEALFSLSIWENLGKEIWDSVQEGNKIAARLAAHWKKCLQMMQQITSETAAQDALKHAIATEIRNINAPAPLACCPAAETVYGTSEPPLLPTAPLLEEQKTPVAAFPVEELNFWGKGNNADVPMAPLTPEEQAVINPLPEKLSQPPLRAEDVPLPMDTDDWGAPEDLENAGEAQNQLCTDSDDTDKDLTTLILEQKKTMLELLKEMRKRDGGKNGQPLTRKSYEKAATAIIESMDSFAKVVGNGEEKSPRDKTQDLIDLCVPKGKLVPDEGKGSEGRYEDRYKGMRQLTDPPSRNTEPARAGPPPPPPPSDPSFSPGQCWRGIIEQATIEGVILPPTISSFPVFTEPGGKRQWAPLDWKTVRELQKAIMQYGIDNKYVQQMIQQFFKAQTLVPADIKVLVEMFFEPTQRLLFHDLWRQKAEEAQVRNLDAGAQNPLAFVSIDMLLGTGQFATGPVQAALRPEVLQLAQQLALEAISEVPQVGKLVPPYSQIMQGEEEPYMKFLDRLKAAVDASPTLTPEAKAAVGKDLAIQNANMKCRQIIASLPRTATLVDIIEACNRLPLIQEQEKAKIHAEAHAAALAVALRPMVRQGKGDYGPHKDPPVCHRCGQLGHLRRACPQRITTQPRSVQTQTNSSRSNFPGVCERCDKFGHKASNCRSKFKKDGTPLTFSNQGNGITSAKMRGAKTSSASQTGEMEYPVVS
ncbi:uncharacterized protein LOC126036373 [Accipiter gentilis]|uniref:uncharacterized protein LOC126036373 n=1 Tax=Astur gentilis TaxID=8957 RepID=UPI00210F71CD|nr:uncharacterized protein LOC126036373 [Accipiter gentilis]